MSETKKKWRSEHMLAVTEEPYTVCHSLPTVAWRPFGLGSPHALLDLTFSECTNMSIWLVVVFLGATAVACTTSMKIDGLREG